MSKEATTVAQGTTTELSVGLGVALMVGVGMVVATLGRKRTTPARSAGGERYAALTAYLHEHLTGADAAIHVVERLRRTQGDADGRPAVRVPPCRVRRQTERRSGRSSKRSVPRRSRQRDSSVRHLAPC